MKRSIWRLIDAIVMWFHSFLFGKKRTQNHTFSTGRKNNTIYQVDSDAEDHIRERLDDIFWKHHG